MKEKTFDFNLSVKVVCKEGEEDEVKQRLLNLIVHDIKHMEGLLTTSVLPWNKSYYFSVKGVEVKCHNEKYI